MPVLSRPSQWLYQDGECYELGHAWHPSCLYSWAEIFCFVFYEALKIYTPLYLVSDVLRRRPLREVVLQTLPHIARSSFFLAVNGGGFVTFICLVRRLLGRFYRYSTAYIPAFLASICAILCERKSRRGLLTGYVSTVAVEFLYTWFKRKYSITPLPYGEVAVFSGATAVLLHKLRCDKNSPDVVGSVLSFLLSPKLPASLVRWSRSSDVFNSRFTGILIVGLWSFLVGYVVQATVSLLSLGAGLFKSKDKVRKALLSKRNVYFGAFLASLAAGFKLVNTLLYYLPLPRDARLLVAGMLAGLSMYFFRSTSLSLYVAGKAVESLYFKGVDRGWLKSWYYGDVLLYALSTATIFHAALFQSHSLRFGYIQFLLQVTHGRIAQVNFDAIDTFGTYGSKKYRDLGLYPPKRDNQAPPTRDSGSTT